MTVANLGSSRVSGIEVSNDEAGRFENARQLDWGLVHLSDGILMDASTIAVELGNWFGGNYC